ncbi:hypothetical protein [Euzebya rosea]|uniref:hypothetical protein n=1 Tax=Euzebya rosea TaxID=2052804 RepID=UPI000D3E2126|nr:hypothetical protein [Euzebya rosea]
MDSLQTMRWILVSMTATAGVIAFALGYVIPGIILLFGVSLHVLHWYTHRDAALGAGPADPQG